MVYKEIGVSKIVEGILICATNSKHDEWTYYTRCCKKPL